jgi:hypothetical protein
MPGTWLAQIAQRYLHRETFALVVSPAIADMQFESPEGYVLRARHYLAVWKALAGALATDVVADVQSLRDDLPILAIVTLMQVSYYVFLVILLSGFGTGRLSSYHPDQTAAMHAVGYVIVIALLCLIPTATCFWPSRRSN